MESRTNVAVGTLKQKHENRGRKEFKNVSDIEESDFIRSTQNFPVADLKDEKIAELTQHHKEINHVIEQPKARNLEAEENLQKAEFNNMVDLKTLINKTQVDPKLLQVKDCARNHQRDRSSIEFTPVFNKKIDRVSLIFADERIVIPELKKKTSSGRTFPSSRLPKRVGRVANSGALDWARLLKTNVLPFLCSLLEFL